MRGERAVVAALGLLLTPASYAAPDPQPWFAPADYVRYFTPGRFETASRPQDGRGIAEVTASGPVRGMAATFRMRLTTIETFPAYDPGSPWRFYKVRAGGDLVMVWDDGRGDYFYTYPAAAFDEDVSEVFLSNDPAPSIRPEDRPAGRLQAFYRNADRRAGRNPDEMEALHKASVVGLWRLACRRAEAAPEGLRFEVECRLTHAASGTKLWTYYRRADLVG